MADIGEPIKRRRVIPLEPQEPEAPAVAPPVHAPEPQKEPV